MAIDLKEEFGLLKGEMTNAVNAFISGCKEFNPKGKTGGILVCADIDGNIIASAQIGEIEGDPQKYYDTAYRKIQQMVDNPGHLSSYPSRDPEKGKWGGGIHLFEIGLFAFSGLPELADEACLLKALDNRGLILDLQFMVEVLALSENRIFENLNC
ncbi:hypothetical protein C0583_03460 [Candidatus Parcubacteria bacterium]|nr:MAG: hypothetical protein C0583_03460 [Candidatus Parcubacteria bacterium]